ncbi:MAG: hypothetical protein QOE66_641, partial [Chloroflexota bacterium]|nr:hypothetical protein [Chloroflexota bacterium]
KQHAGTQFDPELVALFCDLYTSHAPTPDPTILAITNTATQDAGRRERRTRTATASSATLAAEGRGLVELNRTDAPATRGRRGDGPGTPPDHRGIATG